MPYNKSPRAFDDVKEALERALISTNGVRIPCPDRGMAVLHRARFNYYRKMDREANKRTYERDHPMWGCSAYDNLVFRLPPRGGPEENILYVQSRGSFTIEEIP